MDGPITTWRPPWKPISLAPMEASSRIDRRDRAANRCAEGASNRELLANLCAKVTTYRPGATSLKNSSIFFCIKFVFHI